MRQIFALIGIWMATSLYCQNTTKLSYQFDLGTTVTIPCKKTIEQWPDIANHPETDYGSDLGCFFEFLMSYGLNDKISISSGLNFNLSKLKIDDKIGILESKGTMTKSYMHLPVFVKYRMADHISLSAGPYLGLIVGATEKGTTYTDTSQIVMPEPDPIIQTLDLVKEYHHDIKKYYKDFDFGLSGQVEYELKLNSKLAGVIFTRFNYGFSNIMDDQVFYKWKNYGLMIGLGIKM
jgi:hypothetical protein